MSKYRSSLSAAQTLIFPNGTRLTAPFGGDVTQWLNDDTREFRAGRLPAQEDTGPVLQSALEEMGFIEQETIHLDATSFPVNADQTLRSPSTSETVILEPARVPVANAALQVVLYADESGGMSWHFPDDFVIGPSKVSVIDDVERMRSAVKTVFTIPTRTAAARRGLDSGQAEMRGWITAIGRKVLKVFVIPLAADLLARPLEKIVAAVERKHGQNLIRSVDASNYATRITTPFQAWSSLANKRCLLIVHGIISSSDGMLSKLPRRAMEALIQEYEGRVVAYDHFTLSIDPDENATWFLDQIMRAVPNREIQFDILCHSRGGIVSRALVERGHRLVPEHKCEFRKVYFVATPNAGSALGDAAHVVDMVDVFTNFLTKLPDGAAAYLIEALLAIIKLLAYTAETALPGLAAMGTGADHYIKKALNSGHERVDRVTYGAAAANYDPDPNSAHAFFTAALNAAVDRTFVVDGKAVANDLVVPCDGVYMPNGNPMFAIEHPLCYAPSDYVYHNDFFAQARTMQHLNRFLGIGDSVDVVDRGVKGAVETQVLDAGDELLRGAYGNSDESSSAEEVHVREVSDEERGNPRSDMSRDGSETTLPAIELKREPHIDFHERVTEGEPNELTVTLQELIQRDSGIENQIDFELAAGQESVTVSVFLSALGFDVSPAYRSMTIRRSRDEAGERVKFTLTAHSTTKAIRRAIHADFFLGGSLIGSVTHFTYVVPKNYIGPESAGDSKSDGFGVPLKARKECDWTLAVVGESPTYQVYLTSRIPNSTFDFRDMGKLKLQEADLAKYLNDILTKQFTAYPKSSGMSTQQFRAAVAAWKSNFMTTIEGVGRRLWQWLPQALRDEYFRRRMAGSAPRSILIHSEEMIFPWELLIPNDVGDGSLTKLRALGIEHILGRWKPGLTTKPTDQMLRVRKVRVLNPNYPPPDTLDWAAKEALELQKLFPSLVSLVVPADLPSVLKLFDESDVQVLHFSGHGEVNLNNPDLNRILLENNQDFDALKLVATKLCAIAQPVVYMNACSVANVGDTVGRAGGFASNFVTNGCSGLIAPLWPINDRRSMEFALALYSKLKLGRAVGEALQELREENQEDPTYYAYTYFGDPWVRLSL